MTTFDKFFKMATGHTPYRYQRRLAEERPLSRLLEISDIRRSKSAVRNLMADPLPRLRRIGFRVEEAGAGYRIRRRRSRSR
jgi:hypothetical protein